MRFILLSVILLCGQCFSQNFEWAKQGNESYAYQIARTPTALYTASTTLISKFDLHGSPIWHRGVSGGGIVGINADSIGNLYVLGNYGSQVIIGSDTLTASGSHANIFVAKYDSLGTVQWVSRTYSNGDAFPAGISINQFGNPLIVGIFLDSLQIGSFVFDSPATRQCFLAEYNSNGVCIWAKHIEAWSFQSGNANPKIRSDKNGNSYVSGDFYNHATFDSFILPAHTAISPYDCDIFLAKLDSSGNFLWARNLGGDFQEITGSFDVDDLGNAYITGYFSSAPAYFGNDSLSTANYDFFTAKYDTDGNCLWAKFGDAGNICAASDGYYTNTPNFISKYDSLGNFQWSKSVPGAMNMAMCSDSNSVYLTGSYNGTVSFDTCVLSSSGNQMFLAKIGISQSPMAIKDVVTEDNLQIYPNPGYGRFTLSYTSIAKKIVRLCIYNSLGECIYQENNPAENSELKKEIIFDNPVSGIYLVELFESNKRIVKKVVVE
jgi:hypothetical protein